jgi:murein DD-endopeptidase MepM/ murein hydrolase activator NlpD
MFDENPDDRTSTVDDREEPATPPTRVDRNEGVGEKMRGLRDRLPSPTHLTVLFVLGILGTIEPSFEWMETFYLFGLFGLWPMVGSLLPTPGGSKDPTRWITSGTGSGIRSLASMIVLKVNPFLQLKGVYQIVGQGFVLLRHRLSLPDPEGFEQATNYRLPVTGDWTIVQGGVRREHSHSWGLLTQRYAYDLVVTDDTGRTHDGDGTQLEDYHCYGQPVVAPADGIVVAVRDGHRDFDRPGGWLDLRQRDPCGNYVTIDHGNGDYSVLAHLQEGSPTVSEGEQVDRGQRIGRCGNSGNSTEPHLHFHVQDRASFFRGMGLPIAFSDVRVRDPDGDAAVRERAYIHEGQEVAPATE